MRLRNLFALVMAGSIFFNASGAWADAEGAKAAYLRGQAQQKAGQYQAALAEYEASLQAEPRYFYSYKQMGTCYYYLGKKAKAVEAYDKYLAAYPGDGAIRKFADGLRPAAASETLAETGTSHAIYTNSLALALTLFNLGYEHRMGGSSLKVEGMFRSWSLGGTYNQSLTMMGAAIGWRFFMNGKRDMSGFFVGPGVNVLSLSETMTAPAGYYFTETGTNTATVSSLFYGLGGEIGYQWIIGKYFLLTPAMSISYETGGTSTTIGGTSSYTLSGVIPGFYLNLGYAF